MRVNLQKAAISKFLKIEEEGALFKLLFELANIPEMLFITLLKIGTVFEGWPYVKFIYTDAQLLGAGMAFRGWLCAILFKLISILFSYILAISVLWKWVASYNVAELGVFASYGSGGIACVWKTEKSVGFVLA